MTAFLLSITALVAYFVGCLSLENLCSNLYFHCDIKKSFPLDNKGISLFLRRFGGKGVIVVALSTGIRALVPVILGGILLGTVEHSDIGSAFALFCLLLGAAFPALYRFKGSSSFAALMVAMFAVSGSTGVLMLVSFVLAFLISRYITAAKFVTLIVMVLITLMSADSLIVRNLLLLSALIVAIENRGDLKQWLGKHEKKLSLHRDIDYMLDEDFEAD